MVHVLSIKDPDKPWDWSGLSRLICSLKCAMQKIDFYLLVRCYRQCYTLLQTQCYTFSFTMIVLLIVVLVSAAAAADDALSVIQVQVENNSSSAEKAYKGRAGGLTSPPTPTPAPPPAPAAPPAPPPTTPPPAPPPAMHIMRKFLVHKIIGGISIALGSIMILIALFCKLGSIILDDQTSLGICLICVGVYGVIAFSMGVVVVVSSNDMTTDHSQFIGSLWTPTVIFAFSLIIILSALSICLCGCILYVEIARRRGTVVPSAAMPDVLIHSAAPAVSKSALSAAASSFDSIVVRPFAEQQSV